MSVREFPNEWAAVPREAVVDWLDHPCTRLLKQQLKEAIAEVDVQAVELVGNSSAYRSGEEFRQTAMNVCSAKVAYEQVVDMLEEAEDYVKA